MPIEMTIAELTEAQEQDLGVSQWHRVEQSRIDMFADATDDHMWLHVDPRRAKEGPFGTTVAHGYLTLSLLPMLLRDVLVITDAQTRINYGVDRVRFTGPVPTGSRVRVSARLLHSRARGESVVYEVGVEVQVEGRDRPALVGAVHYLVG